MKEMIRPVIFSIAFITSIVWVVISLWDMERKRSRMEGHLKGWEDARHCEELMRKYAPNASRKRIDEAIAKAKGEGENQ